MNTPFSPTALYTNKTTCPQTLLDSLSARAPQQVSSDVIRARDQFYSGTLDTLARRVACVTCHLVAQHDSLLHVQPKVVNETGETGLRSFFNKYLKGKASRLADILPRRRPKKVGPLEAAGIWLALTLVSIPWLSYILILSFLRKKRAKTVSLTNAWANFVLKKILRINIIVDDKHSGVPSSYGSPPYIFVLLNQYSLLESMLILPAVIPPNMEVFAFANIEFLMIPLVGQNRLQAKGAVNRAIRRMKDDKASMIISIEGRRSADGSLSEYKKGPAILAIKTGATIIPVVIHGTREIWNHGDWKVKTGGDVLVKFLEGIDTHGLTMNDRFMLTQKLRDIADRELFGKFEIKTHGRQY
eukprot:TRINITY_DN2888_c0_g1_i2.p1 TRINITY_DN2888_c0_g1~~TRINITY_DN2888_c0_g1_i2.p1  ORF type:complete len:357 (-),score=49.56 TRINITY_DN2888_c0_g1_i2:85-1155(-)